MKKRNLVLLFLISVITLCAFTGLLIFAFDIQAAKDLQNRIKNSIQHQQSDQNSSTSPEQGVTSVPTDTIPITPTPSITPEPDAQDTSDSSTPVVLGFAGDVNLDESNPPVAKYDAEGQDITQCFSTDLLDEMRSADVMMLNNEFSYSNRGTKAEDKSFTFRAKPERVNILKEMGVDIVSLANNHALDYGPDALQDTFDALENAGIDYVGAGENLDRAKAPVYYTIGNKTVAFVSASRVVFAMDWYASDSKLGMIGTYDPALILDSIKEAKANSDYVVMFVHWGVERENYPEDYQRTLAKQYIDAGADAVIGGHPHVMQGIEYYKGKPIAYSLGNYWFNSSKKESGMVKLYLDSDGNARFQLLPVMNRDTRTYLLTDKEEKKGYYDYMRKLSPDVTIDEDGFVE